MRATLIRKRWLANQSLQLLNSCLVLSVHVSRKPASANPCQLCLHNRARHFSLPPIPAQASTSFVPVLFLGPQLLSMGHSPLSGGNIKTHAHFIIPIILINQHVLFKPVDKKTLGVGGTGVEGGILCLFKIKNNLPLPKKTPPCSRSGWPLAV